MDSKKFRIALALRSDAVSSTRHFFLGAQKFAHTQPDWQIVREDNTTMLNWEQAIQSQPDGILGVLFGEQQRSIEPGITGNAQVVILNQTNEDHPFHKVVSNNAEIGRRAATYLLDLRLENFAFIRCGGSVFSHQRQIGFLEGLKIAGCKHLVPIRSIDPDETPDGFGQWLKNLPKPCGVFCANDHMGSETIDACQQAGILVPDEIAILGVSNDELVCGAALVTLSSIGQNFDTVGYRAAEFLDRLLRGLPTPREPVLVPTGEVIIRKSTQMFAVDDPLVRRALAIIHDEPGESGEPLKIKPLLARLGSVSQRLLDIRFKETLGRSPYQEIIHARVNFAKKWLRSTHEPLEEIAYKAGFSDPAQLSSHFRRICGITPSQYRKSQQADS